jgi:uncharacterized membrane protein (DUF373 family)
LSHAGTAWQRIQGRRVESSSRAKRNSDSVVDAAILGALRSRQRPSASLAGGLRPPDLTSGALPISSRPIKGDVIIAAAPRRDFAMLNIAHLKREWKDLTSYERFEQIVSRVVMLFVAVVIVYALILVAINLFLHFLHGLDFVNGELLQDVFGPILTILILIEFNHSIALSLTKKSGILQARTIVLIAILVIARKVILLDFKTATLATFAGIGAIALAFGALYWLIGARAGADKEAER